MPKTRIIWSDGFVRVAPKYPLELKEKLRYYSRTLAPDETTHQQVWTGQYRDCFQTGVGISADNQVEEWLLTYPGFMHRVKKVLEDAGWEYEVVDIRKPFPAPDWNAALSSLRDYQCECAWTAINSGGGIVACPTGWGKTHIIAAIIKAFPHAELCLRNTPLVVLAGPDKDLARQNARRLKEYLPGRDVGLVSSDAHQFTDDIQVCTLDSMNHVPMHEVGVLIIDEVHQAATEDRADTLSKAVNARRWGASATPTGRFDGSDIVTEGLVGPIVYQRTYEQGVADGALVPILVYWIPVPPPHIGIDAYHNYTTRKRQVDWGIERNESQRDLIVQLMRTIPDTMQTLCIMQHTAQMNILAEYLPGVKYVHACSDPKKLRDARQYNLAPVKPAERRGIYTQFRDGHLRKIMATYVYKQGVDFPDLQVMIQAGGGGSEIAAGQIPGRASRPAAGKDVSYLIEFYHPWDVSQKVDPETHRIEKKMGPLLRDDKARGRVYSKLNFQQFWINKPDELPFISGQPPPPQQELLRL